MSNANVDFSPLNLTMNVAGAAVGTTTTTSFTANPLAYVINGKHLTKATVTNGATPTTDVNTSAAFTGVAANKGTVLVFGYNAAGTLQVAQGSIESLDASGAFLKAPSFPAIPDTMCPYAYIVVKVGSTGSTWTCGTSNFAGPPTGVTFTIVDVAALPDRPQIS